jgi:IclR family KDG regulon transcriptional repressor
MDKTLVKGVELLECLLRADAPCGVTELARLSGLNPSNVHRTLQTWAHLGFVAQDAHTGAYHCTLRLFEWGCRVADGYDVRRVAREHLARLSRSTQETIHLSVLDGAEIVYLDKIDSPQPVRAYSEIGGRAPAHCVATGKMLLAHAGSAALAALPSPLPRPTPKTVPDTDALRTQLQKFLRQGYAVNREEWRVGVSGLGAAVFDQHGRAIAAVGLSAPSSRLVAAREVELGASLVATADAITQALGGGNAGMRPEWAERRRHRHHVPTP